MAKEQFVRSKPHVNIGVVLLILVLAAAAAAGALIYLSPPPDDGADLQPPPDDGAEANAAFEDVNAEWVLVQEGCEALTLATQVEFTLTVVDTQNPPPGPDSVLLFALFAPPETLDGLAGGELEPIAAGIWRPQVSLFDVSDETHSAQFPVFALESVEGEDAAAGGEGPGEFWKFVIVGGQTVSLPNAEAPDSFWMPVYGADSVGDPVIGDPVISISIIDSDGESIPDMQLLLFVIPDPPDIAGLFKDTAEGGTIGTGWDLSVGEISVDPQLGAIYRFKLGQAEGLVVFPPSPFEISTDKVNPAGDSSLWFTPYAILPYLEQDNLYDSFDMEILEAIPFVAKWATVDGLSVDTNMVEYREGSPICTATPTVTDTPIQAIATPTATQASGGSEQAPSETPQPSRTPPRSTPTPKATETPHPK